MVMGSPVTQSLRLACHKLYGLCVSPKSRYRRAGGYSPIHVLEKCSSLVLSLAAML